MAGIYEEVEVLTEDLTWVRGYELARYVQAGYGRTVQVGIAGSAGIILTVPDLRVRPVS